jgi:hypothetical protein
MVEYIPLIDWTSVGLILGITLLVIWSAIWKGIGLWKAGRNNQLQWFVALLIFNTAGILPIVYLKWFQKKSK